MTVRESPTQAAQQPNAVTPLTFLGDHVENFFTDTEYLRQAFEELLTAPSSAPRVLSIHGSHMMGKSALLAMLQLSCERKGIHTALVNGRHAKTPQDILREFSDQLEKQGLLLPIYRKVLKVYLEDPFKAPQPWDSKVAEVPDLDKPFERLAKGVEKASQSHFLVDIAWGIISGVRDVFNYKQNKKKIKLAEEEALLKQKIKEQLSKGSFKALSEAFKGDLENLSGAQPELPRSIVLMLDHFEQVIDPDYQLRDWVAELVSNRRLLLVIAGRDSIGPAWTTKIRTQTNQLFPMSELVIGELVRNYCRAKEIDSPKDIQVSHIVKFAAPVPYLALWAIEMCREKLVTDWDIEKFLQLRPSEAREIGERLEALLSQSTESLSKKFARALEAAAIVQWFDRGILRDLIGDDADQFYSEVAKLPVVFRNDDYLSIPGAVREVINRKLMTENPELYVQMNEKASRSYERRLKLLEADPERLNNKQTLVLGNLYHKYQFADNDAEAALRAEKYFREAFADGFNRRQYDFCASLVEQVKRFDPLVTSKDWVKHYSALMQWYRRIDTQKARETLEQLSENPKLDDELLADVYESLGWINWEEFSNEGGVENAKKYFAKALLIRQRNPADIAGRARIQVWLGILYQRTEGKGEQYLGKALGLDEELKAQTDRASSEDREQLQHGRAQLRPIFAWAHHEMGNSLMLQGRFAEAGQELTVSIDTYKRLGLWLHLGRSYMTFGKLQIYQGQLNDAVEALEKSIRLLSEYKEPWTEAWAHAVLGDVALRRGNLLSAQGHYNTARDKWTGDRFGTAVADGGMADVALARGELDLASQIAEATLQVKKSSQDLFGQAWTLNTIGNIFVAQESYEQAQQSFEEGLGYAKEYGSFFVESMLALGLCRVHYCSGNQSGFDQTAKEVEDLADSYGYMDHLAPLLFFRGALELRTSNDQGLALSADELENITALFVESLTTALKHNIFVLDELLKETIRTVKGYERLKTERGDSVRKEIIRLLGNRWKSTKTTTRQTLESLERSQRTAEDVEHAHRKTVQDQLKQAQVISDE